MAAPASSVSLPAPGAATSVQVALRIRPLNQREQTGGSKICCVIDGPNGVLLLPPVGRSSRKSAPNAASKESSHTEKQLFSFDYVYGDGPDVEIDGQMFERNSQERVFKELGSIVLSNAFAGFNFSLLAYGQTGAGKSHTVSGYDSSRTLTDDKTKDESGLIPRICNVLFAKCAADTAADPLTTYSVNVSYLEIYSEKIQDLLDKTKRNLTVRNHPSRGPYVEGLTIQTVASYADMHALIEQGNAIRTVAATNMNAQSSRSHAVFTVVLTQTKRDPEVKLASKVESKIQLVDLAGSERQDTSGATGIRLKEAAQINLSLSTLGRVISALAAKSQLEASGKPGKLDENFVPYRDSALTFLLKESLGGNSKTLLIAACSPADMNFEETLSTLRYASAAKNIKNKAIVNEDANSVLIRTLRAEIDALKAQLAQGGGGGGGGNAVAAAPVVNPADAEAAAMVEKLRAQLEANAQSMKEMEAAWMERLAESNRVANQRLEELVAAGASLAEAKTQLAQEQTAAAAALAAAVSSPLATASPAASPSPLDSTAEPLEPLSPIVAAASPASPVAVAAASPTAAVADDLSATPFLINLADPLPAGSSLVLALLKGSTSITRAAVPAADEADDGAAVLPPPSLQCFAIQGDCVRDRHAELIYDEDADTVTLRYLAPSGAAGAAASSSSAPADLFVNNLPLLGAQTLMHGDRIRLGGVESSLETSTSVCFRFSRSIQELQRARQAGATAAQAITRRPKPTVNTARESGGGELIQTLPPVEEDAGAGSGLLSALASTASLAASASLSTASLAASASSSAFALARSVFTSDPARRWSSWVRNASVCAPALDALVARETKLLPRHKQKKITAAATLAAATSSATHAHALTFVLRVLYKWRLRLLRRRVSDQMMMVLFAVDEANAYCASLGLPQRYRVELHSRFVPPALLGPADARSQAATTSSDGNDPVLSLTPLQRLRSLHAVCIDVVSYRPCTRARAATVHPAVISPADIWGASDFLVQLSVLRDKFRDVIEEGGGADGDRDEEHSQSMVGRDHRLLSLPSRMQLIGTAMVFLEALRYGQPLRHRSVVLGVRGDPAGWLNVELELSLVGAEEASRVLEAEEAKSDSFEGDSDAESEDEVESVAHRRTRSHVRHASLTSSIGTPNAGEAGAASPKALVEAGTGLLSLSVRIVSYESARFPTDQTPSAAGSQQSLSLASLGCKSVQVRYAVHDDSYAFRTKRIRLRSDAAAAAAAALNPSSPSSSSSLSVPVSPSSPHAPASSSVAGTGAGPSTSFAFQHFHYFSGTQLSPLLLDFLAHDALTFDVVGRFEESLPEAAVEAQAQAAGAAAAGSSAAGGAAPANAAKAFEAFAAGADEGDSDDENSRAGSRIGSRRGSRANSSAEPPSPTPMGSSMLQPQSQTMRYSSPSATQTAMGGSASSSAASTPLPSPSPTPSAGPSSALRTPGGGMPKFTKNAPVRIDTSKARLSLGGANPSPGGPISTMSPGSARRGSAMGAGGAAGSGAGGAAVDAEEAAASWRGSSFGPDHTVPFVPEPATAASAAAPPSTVVPVGRKTADQLLYVVADLEEETSSGVFASAVIKGGHGSTEATFKLTSHRHKKMVLSLLQVDHDSSFVVESLSSVRLLRIERCRAPAEGSTGKGLVLDSISTDAAEPLLLLDQFAHMEHRLLVASVDWSRYLDDHPCLRGETPKGERVQLVFRVELVIAKATQPLCIEIEMGCKSYRKPPSASSGAAGFFSRKKSGGASGEDESSRLPRLGTHFLLRRQATSSSIAPLFVQHELMLSRLQKQVRHEQVAQHSAFLRRVAEAKKDPAAPVGEVAAVEAPTLDSLTSLPTPSLSALVAVAASASGSSAGIDVVVTRVAKDVGVHAGFLSMQSGMPKLTPAAAGSAASSSPSSPSLLSVPKVGSGKWRPKWCVLRPPYLLYFSRRGDAVEKGLIHLFQARFQLNPLLANTFLIHTTTRSYHLQAASERELKVWMRSMAPKDTLERLGLIPPQQQQSQQQSLFHSPQSSPNPLHSPSRAPRARGVVTPHKRAATPSAAAGTALTQ